MRFFNNSLINILNEKLEIFGNNKYLEKFPQFLVSDVKQKRSNEIFNINLRKIFEGKRII